MLVEHHPDQNPSDGFRWRSFLDSLQIRTVEQVSEHLVIVIKQCLVGIAVSPSLVVGIWRILPAVTEHMKFYAWIVECL